MEIYKKSKMPHRGYQVLYLSIAPILLDAAYQWMFKLPEGLFQKIFLKIPPANSPSDLCADTVDEDPHRLQMRNLKAMFR